MLLIFMKQRIGFRFHTLQERVLRWTKPPTTSLLLDTLADRALGEIGIDGGKRALLRSFGWCISLREATPNGQVLTDLV